ncbi:hypothetical protein E2C01_061325 [Portunus trituberculatus]|uniref:Uncharacterized protein n=1 Tax=Portunus trituberculatus TaxID=210409 RepID=A0A5B7HBC9_PORTR|nr:hypothetical protein [Portunus trituberculatus]
MLRREGNVLVWYRSLATDGGEGTARDTSQPDADTQTPRSMMRNSLHNDRILPNLRNEGTCSSAEVY